MEQVSGLKFNEAAGAGGGFTRGLLQLRCHDEKVA
jgi:hypothetical protein